MNWAMQAMSFWMKLGKKTGVVVALMLGGCASEPAFGSVGAILGRDNDTHALYIREVPEGMGADAAGLRPGDEILMVDGHYVRSLGKEEVIQMLRGPVGTSLRLTVLRGEEVIRAKVERTAIRGQEAPKGKEERLEP